MDTKTLEALKGSVAKWEGVVAGTVEDLGSDNCPLCKQFVEAYCRGCPVAEKAGKNMCRDTPYYDFDEPEIKHDGAGNFLRYLHSEDSVAQAQAELDFLKSLLPAGA